MERKRKERKEEGVKGEKERREMRLVATVSGLYFLDQWRRVNGEVNDAHSATYLRQFQSHGRTRGAVGTSSSHFVTAGM